MSGFDKGRGGGGGGRGGGGRYPDINHILLII